MLVIAGVNAVTFVTDPSYVNDVAVVDMQQGHVWSNICSPNHSKIS